MRKRVNKKLIIILSIAAVLVLGGAVYLFTTLSKDDNGTKVFESYKDKWEKQDFKSMYSMLSSATKEKISEKQFVDRYTNIYSGIEAKNISIKLDNNDKSNNKSSSAKLPFSITMDTAAGNLKIPGYELNLVREKINGKNQWTIQWDEKMIFPNLGPDDKVRVNIFKAKRGEIDDKSGKALAENGPIYIVGLQPSKFMINKEANTAKLAEVLDIDTSVIDNKLKVNTNSDQFVPIVNISSSDKSKVSEATKIDGVRYQQGVGRVYPGGEAFGSLIGYIGPITAEELGNLKDQGYSSTSFIGKAGLEQVYEKRLKGLDGAEIYISKQKDNKEIEKITLIKNEPKDGESIKLFVDFDLQNKIYSSMNKDSGACAAIDPKSGEVLALVSSPSYDSNALTCYATNTQKTAWKNGPDPFQNRFKNVYAPGSTFKLYTAAVGLSNGKIKPDEAVSIQGKQWQPDKSWGTYYITRVDDSIGQLNLKNAFVHSDNIYFARAALSIGKDEFVKSAESFGLGEKLPIEYPFAKSQLSNDNKINSAQQLADSGYGQGEVLVSPLQLALMYSTLVNDGNIMTPLLESSSSVSPKVWKEKVISQDNIKILKDDLTAVIEDPSGTGHGAKINGQALAGKTGTAELDKLSADDKNGKENGWFVCMNIDNPKIVVSMIVEDVKNRSGSHYTVPKVKDIMNYYLTQGGGK
ncbi:penicillin-binding transpeptidase domain-containing protein [Candidatus Clostridium radicumherbarum]|uniref:Penicillin-binding transpeptidase domain-containing protein n=1 Tax=Candidatus Clostridium radicumherbarum TaxID=3381662 RepID=A0ABW8TRE9_9CLOT